MSTTSWVETTLGEVAEIVGGATPKTSVDDYWDGDVYWATPKDLSELEGAEIHSTPRSLTQAGLRSCSARVLPPGSVLLSSRAPIGHVAINTVPMATNQGFKSLIPDHGRVDAKFLYWWLRRNRRALEAMGTGATFKEISKRTTAAVPIQLPSIEEQRRIAAVLDEADELRAKRREALAKLDTLTQAIFIDMFGRSDHTFELASIGDLVAPGKNNIRTGPFGSQLLHEEFTEEGIAVLGIDNAVSNRFVWGKRRFISAEKYEQLTRFTVRPGDVLVTIMATTGRVAVVPDDIPTAINTKHLCCITLDQSKCLPWYLWAALRFDASVRRQLGATHGAVMPGLNMGKIKQAELPLPPLHLQEQFVQRLNAVERQSSMSATSQGELSLLFASLQQRAFRGEL